MLPILPKMDEVGYEFMEMWGGATFDVAIRYLGDDPWERVREFKKLCKKTPLRMLLYQCTSTFLSFGVVFQPRTFSAQDLSTSELLRTL